MNIVKISQHLLVFFMISFLGFASNAQSVNECNASAKIIKSERAANGSPSWRFIFQVYTNCDASSGSFEYEYRVKGSAGGGIPRTAPAWNSANGRTFSWTDEVNIGTSREAEFVRFIPGTFGSKKVR